MFKMKAFIAIFLLLCLFVSIMPVTGFTCCYPCSTVVNLNFFQKSISTKVAYIIPRIMQIREKYQNLKKHKLLPGVTVGYVTGILKNQSWIKLDYNRQFNLDVFKMNDISLKQYMSKRCTQSKSDITICDYLTDAKASYMLKNSMQAKLNDPTLTPGQKLNLIKRSEYYKMDYQRVEMTKQNVKMSERMKKKIKQFSINKIDAESSSQAWKDIARMMYLLNQLDINAMRIKSISAMTKSIAYTKEE